MGIPPIGFMPGIGGIGIMLFIPGRTGGVIGPGILPPILQVQHVKEVNLMHTEKLNILANMNYIMVAVNLAAVLSCKMVLNHMSMAILYCCTALHLSFDFSLF